MNNASPVQKAIFFKEVIESLEYKMQSHHINLLEIHGQSSDADLSNKATRTVIINPNFDTSFSLPFRLAHEMAHVLYGEKSKTYLFSPLSKKNEEIKANIFAIRMLCDLYFVDYGSNAQRWENRFIFIELFGLQPLAHLVEQVLLEKYALESPS